MTLLLPNTIVILLFPQDCDPLASKHVPHFVDTLQGNIPGTFVEPPVEFELTVDEMVGPLEVPSCITHFSFCMQHLTGICC